MNYNNLDVHKSVNLYAEDLSLFLTETGIFVSLYIL